MERACPRDFGWGVGWLEYVGRIERVVCGRQTRKKGGNRIRGCPDGTLNVSSNRQREYLSRWAKYRTVQGAKKGY